MIQAFVCAAVPRGIWAVKVARLEPASGWLLHCLGRINSSCDLVISIIQADLEQGRWFMHPNNGSSAGCIGAEARTLLLSAGLSRNSRHKQANVSADIFPLF